jgi:ribosomal protein S18 acetylase RimI-like enzyme
LVLECLEFQGLEDRMTIRHFDPRRDMDRVVSLYQQCFAEPTWHERFDPQELELEFKEMHTWPDAVFLVNEQGGIVTGGAIGFDVSRKPDVTKLLPEIDRKSFYVAELFVDPLSRQRGICTLMSETLLSQAARSGQQRMIVRTSTAQAVIERMFVGNLGSRVVATQDVVSTKWLDGQMVQVPD